MSHFLNKKFEINLSYKDYKILLGHWVWRYCNIIISRQDNLKLILKNKPEIVIFSKIKNDFENITINTHDILLKSNDNVFNSSIYYNLAKSINLKYINKVFIEPPKKNNHSFKLSIKTFIKTFLYYNQYLVSFFIPNQKYFFFHTYIKRKYFFKIIYKLGILRSLYFSKNIFDKRINTKLRNELNKVLQSYKYKDEYSEAIYSNLKYYFPSIYLEGLKLNLNNSYKYPWPQKPKYIVSANSFDENEYFKFYVISKTKNYNSKYIAIQHGNNCGSFILKSHNIEQETSDTFFTWGWKSSKYNNHVPLFNVREPFFNMTFKNNSKYNIPLLILNGYPYDWNIYNDTLLYELNHNLLLKSLRKYLRKIKIDIKKYHYMSSQQQKINEALNNFSSNLGFVNPYKNIKKFIKSYHIIIFCYDSTGFSELINLNKPCLMYVDQPLKLYDNKAQSIYKKMFKNKIFFDDLDLIFKHYIDIKDNIGEWWNSMEVKNAIDLFRSSYSNTSKKPDDRFIELLKNVQ